MNRKVALCRVPLACFRWPLAAAAALLASCSHLSHVYFEPATETLAESAATIGNKQILLNLARESNEEPAYFVQLGSISGSLTLSSAIGLPGTNSLFTVNQASSGATSSPKSVGTIGANLTTTITENPIFSLTPITGFQFAQTIVEPFSAKVFAALLLQGWSADTLARVMVSDAEVVTTDAGGAVRTEIWRNDPSTPNYSKFIRLCCELKVAVEEELVTIEAKKLPNSLQIQDPEFDGGAPAKSDAPEFNGVKLSDAVKANAAGLQFVHPRDKDGHPKSAFILQKEDKDTSYFQIIKRDPAKSATGIGLDTLAAYMEDDRPIFLEVRPDKLPNKTSVICLHLFSFEGALANISQEQQYYDGPCDPTKTPPGDKSRKNLLIQRKYHIGGRTIIARPALYFQECKDHYEPVKDTRIVSLTHDGETYTIGSCGKDDNDSENQTPTESNREVFTLLVYLFNVSAIDSTKLVIPQVLAVP